MFEYTFSVDNDDDKGVPFGPVNKDNLDIVRVVVDFTSWLDVNESVTEISYLTVLANPSLPLPPWQANYPLDETSKTPPFDQHPLLIVDNAVIHSGKAVILDLAAGTPQLSYAVSFTAVAGLSRRRRLVDILMVIDKPLNSGLVADGAPIPTFVYPLIIHTTTIMPLNFNGRVYVENNTAQPILITLPQAPVLGQVISFLDIASNFDDYNVTFQGAPGTNILGLNDVFGPVVSNAQREDILFEWTGSYWEVTRKNTFDELYVIDSLRVRAPLHPNDLSDLSTWAQPTDHLPIYIGPWQDKTATSLHQSLFIQHWYDAPSNSTPGVASPIGVQINIEGAPNYYVWGFNMEMDIRTSGSIQQPQHVGYAMTLRRHSGSNDVAFAYYGMIEDVSGRANASDVGFELDIRCNGPEPVSTEFAGWSGGRAIMTMNAIAEERHPARASSTFYAKDSVMQVNGFTYIARNDGTSAAVQPSFPGGGAPIADGGIIWDYGTTVAAQISRALNISTSGNMELGTGVLIMGNYYDCGVDLTFAVMSLATNPRAAGIRLAPDMAIDFSSEAQDFLQNRNILYFDRAASEFRFTTLDTSNQFLPRLAIHSDGRLRVQVSGLPHATDDAMAAAAPQNVPIGGIYRNGSTLMVRTT